MFIFENALDAHKHSKWTLSIPALLPQIEGIAIDILRERGLDFSRKSLVIKKSAKRKTAQTLASQVFSLLPIDSFSLSEMVAIYTLLHYLEGQLYGWTDFLGEANQSEEQDSLNRHAILHGVQINYASQENSLKCFLVLDALQLTTKALKQSQF